MRIAQVAPLYESVPPRHYGGTERVVSYLTEELVARGHEVTLFASGDSTTLARLVPWSRRSLRLGGGSADPVALHLAMLLDVYGRAPALDVVHCHTDYLGLPLAAHAAVPTVLTLHGRLDLPDVHPVYRAFRSTSFVSISDAQRAPLRGVPWAGTVHHGLPPDLYRFHPAVGKSLAFLGRISPEKKPDAAIRIAIAAGVPLRIAAKVDPADRDYFATVVKPLLDHPLIEFVGEVTDREKEALLQESLALLFPVDWPEPFGLAVIEALACGTPVIARRRGSTPELIVDGLTGFLCDTDDEMVDAVGRVAGVSRAVCRADFEHRFTVGRMVDAYLDVYHQAQHAHRGRQRLTQGGASRPRRRGPADMAEGAPALRHHARGESD